MAVLISTLSFVSRKQENIPCGYITVKILDSIENRFVTKKDILKVISNTQRNILGSPLYAINTQQLEKAVLKNRAIKNCYVFTTYNGALNVEIMQRQPVLRIINQNNTSYYLGQEGYLIPFSSIQTTNVLVATGYIKENLPLNLKTHEHVSVFDRPGSDNILRDLHELAGFIYEDPFWKSQFVQIYVNKKGEIELIPRVGAHIIILGKADGFEQKLSKLKVFYKKGLNNLGWNSYETINLKYKNQVICTKR